MVLDVFSMDVAGKLARLSSVFFLILLLRRVFLEIIFFFDIYDRKRFSSIDIIEFQC
jgi:hypothetical protein